MGHNRGMGHNGWWAEGVSEERLASQWPRGHAGERGRGAWWGDSGLGMAGARGPGRGRGMAEGAVDKTAGSQWGYGGGAMGAW